MKALRSGSRLFGYGFAALGPIGSAGAQFVLSLQVLHVLDPAVFGTFAFLLLLSQLSLSVSSALLVAPFPVAVAADGVDRRSMLACFHSANLVYSALVLVVFWIIGTALGLGTGVALIFGAYAALMALRWFGRAYNYFHGWQGRTIRSDLLYGLLLLGAVWIMQATGTASLLAATLGLLAAAAISTLVLGRDFLLCQATRLSLHALGTYRAIWRNHSRWSLAGVATTELTANAHAYVVTLLIGPLAFAPLAASALLIRPINLAANALRDFERPRLARILANQGTEPAVGALRAFSAVLFSVWTGCAVLAAAIAVYAPGAIFPPEYARGELLLGASLWFGVTLLRNLRTPSSVLLQAAGQFRPLASASSVSCGVSIAAVAGLTFLLGPVWSIAGVALGEMVFAAMVSRQFRRWRQTRRTDASTPATAGQADVEMT
ncbi:hypothetical protein IC608_15070 [Devosia sp. PTR5]|uniref:Uncharacterized protein n=1 Tax=Devosia oryzisoli TaxID=2774138 RepID=A0A927FX88_9HYPH|nr:hypothetical protein [Devosia oryzisoli]MBD8066794.1 hypothetical protein [Devosia oryzisoli]